MQMNFFDANKGYKKGSSVLRICEKNTPIHTPTFSHALRNYHEKSSFCIAIIMPIVINVRTNEHAWKSRKWKKFARHNGDFFRHCIPPDILSAHCSFLNSIINHPRPMPYRFYSPHSSRLNLQFSQINFIIFFTSSHALQQTYFRCDFEFSRFSLETTRQLCTEKRRPVLVVMYDTSNI